MSNITVYGQLQELPDRSSNVGGSFYWNDNNKIGEASRLLTQTNDMVYSMPSHFQKEINPLLGLYTNTTLAAAFSGGVVAPNGKIYFIPDTETYVYEMTINMSRNSISSRQLGAGLSASSTKWQGGVLSDRGIIYGIPYVATGILRINPTNGQVSTLTGSTITNFYIGGVVAQNGLVVSASGGAATSLSILLIDTTNETYREQSITNGTAGITFNGACLAPNGWVYFTPESNDIVGAYNPSTKEYKEFPVPTSTGTSNKYDGGGILTPDGKICFIPRSSSKVLLYDPISNKGELIGDDLTATTNKWRCGVLGPDGYIYGIPYSSTQILKVDWKTKTTKLFENVAGTTKFAGGVLAPNGNIYGVTYSSDTILQITMNTHVKNNVECSKDINKY